MSEISILTEKSYCFIPDADECFLPAKVLTTFKRGDKGTVEIVEIASKNASKRQEEKKRAKTVTLNPDQSKQIMGMDAESLQGMANMVALKQLNNASILHNLRIRFYNDEIYTAIGTILVSVNPFKVLPLYTPKIIDDFISLGSTKNQPHVYGVADDAYKQMVRFYKAQSCIVAGESGAGAFIVVVVFSPWCCLL